MPVIGKRRLPAIHDLIAFSMFNAARSASVL